MFVSLYVGTYIVYDFDKFFRPKQTMEAATILSESAEQNSSKN